MEDQGNVKRKPDPNGVEPITLPYKPPKPEDAKKRGQRRAAKALGEPAGY